MSDPFYSSHEIVPLCKYSKQSVWVLRMPAAAIILCSLSPTRDAIHSFEGPYGKSTQYTARAPASHSVMAISSPGSRLPPQTIVTWSVNVNSWPWLDQPLLPKPRRYLGCAPMDESCQFVQTICSLYLLTDFKHYCRGVNRGHVQE